MTWGEFALFLAGLVFLLSIHPKVGGRFYPWLGRVMPVFLKRLTFGSFTLGLLGDAVSFVYRRFWTVALLALIPALLAYGLGEAQRLAIAEFFKSLTERTTAEGDLPKWIVFTHMFLGDGLRIIVDLPLAFFFMAIVRLTGGAAFQPTKFFSLFRPLHLLSAIYISILIGVAISAFNVGSFFLFFSLPASAIEEPNRQLFALMWNYILYGSLFMIFCPFALVPVTQLSQPGKTFKEAVIFSWSQSLRIIVLFAVPMIGFSILYVTFLHRELYTLQTYVALNTNFILAGFLWHFLTLYLAFFEVALIASALMLLSKHRAVTDTKEAIGSELKPANDRV